MQYTANIAKIFVGKSGDYSSTSWYFFLSATDFDPLQMHRVSSRAELILSLRKFPFEQLIAKRNPNKIFIYQ